MENPDRILVIEVLGALNRHRIAETQRHLIGNERKNALTTAESPAEPHAQ